MKKIFFLEWLEKTGIKKRLEKNAKKTTGVFFIAWFLTALFFQQLVLSIGIAFVFAVLGFWAFDQYPHWKEKNRFEKAETELPFLLLEMSIALNAHQPFERVLQKAAHSDYGFAGAEFQKVCIEINAKGASVSEALLHLTERLKGLDAKRAVIQLIHAYEQGNKKNKGTAVKRMASELLAKQQIQAKAFGNKLALYALVFIAVSAIAPAMFQSFVLVGSAFLNMDFSPLQVLIINTVAFPLLDLTVLAIIWMKTPLFLR